MSSLSCMCCNRPLSVQQSIQRGLGPICYGKQLEALESGDATGDKVDIPFDPKTMDIICRRDAEGLHFNIFQVFAHHSPSGMEWGYGGSGPADFALNVMAMFTNHLEGPRDLLLFDGRKISSLAWNLHQRFKFAFIAALPSEGGTIKGDDIREWVEKESAATRLSFAA